MNTTMENLHTLGNWEIEGTTKKGNPYIITAGKKGFVIAEVTNQELGGKYDLTPDRSLSNAKLIAAAPELLDASQSVLATLKAMNQNSMIEGMIMVLEEALTKATGKGKYLKGNA